MAPFHLAETLGSTGFYLIVFLIGLGFGIVLELAGFGDSRKLAAQFYFKELTVLKVMFTGIIVAMVLIFLSSAFGILDYDRVWVNPTYLWPGIIGGLIMGVGFILGGFCPGTAIVSMCTFKIDGLFFVVGAFCGIFVFGESVDKIGNLWISGDMGRFTLPEFLGWDTGLVVLAVVLMALGMFWGSEQLEQLFCTYKEKLPVVSARFKKTGVAVILLLALTAWWQGQPTIEDKWEQVPTAIKAQLQKREIHVSPLELLHAMKGRYMNCVLLDFRNESDYNIFHIIDFRRTALEQTTKPEFVKELKQLPENTAVILASNGEAIATKAWKNLVAQKIQNVYILEGGVNNWLAYFADAKLEPIKDKKAGRLRYHFESALGARHPWADPDFNHYRQRTFTARIKLQMGKPASGGGCG